MPDHLSSPIKNGGRKWTGDETNFDPASIRARLLLKYMVILSDTSVVSNTKSVVPLSTRAREQMAASQDSHAASSIAKERQLAQD